MLGLLATGFAGFKGYQQAKVDKKTVERDAGYLAVYQKSTLVAVGSGVAIGAVLGAIWAYVVSE